MTQIVQSYPNAVVRTISVVSAEVTEDADTILLLTQEYGQMAVCRIDSPSLWQQLVAAGLVAA